MKHPSPEEWMEFLYRETPASPALQAHLEVCETCQDQIKQWQTVKKSLDSWTLTVDRRSHRSLWTDSLRWVAAAILLLSTGYMAHSLFTPHRTDYQSLAKVIEPLLLQSVQNSIRPHLQEQWQSDLQVLRDQLDKQHLEFQQLVLSAMGQSTVQTRKVLNGMLTAYQQERQQWTETLQALQLQRESDQRTYQNYLTRLAIATGHEIQQAKAGIRALATTATYRPEENDQLIKTNPE